MKKEKYNELLEEIKNNKQQFIDILRSLGQDVSNLQKELLIKEIYLNRLKQKENN